MSDFVPTERPLLTERLIIRLGGVFGLSAAFRSKQSLTQFFFGHSALSFGIGAKRSFFLRKGYNFPEHLIFRLVP